MIIPKHTLWQYEFEIYKLLEFNITSLNFITD